MRNLQELSKKIAALVQLLSEMGGLEIRAEVSHDEGVPGISGPQVLVRFTGRDTPILIADNGRVLDAIETVSLDMLNLPDAVRENIRFDAENFLADQTIRLRRSHTWRSAR
jgi:predicted RNA-binding protein Jag